MMMVNSNRKMLDRRIGALFGEPRFPKALLLSCGLPSQDSCVRLHVEGVDHYFLACILDP